MLNSINGIVLVDEIDLHLHPAWQRQVVQLLSKTFPRLQFVFTSHSPLIATSVKRENIFIIDRAENGTATISQIAEHAFGQSVEQMLLSSYFGLTTTRPESFAQESESLFKRVADGDSGAALEFLKRVTSPSRSAG